MHDVLWVLSELLRRVAIVLQPFMPESSAKILDQLSVPLDHRNYYSFKKLFIDAKTISEPEAIFPKYLG